jgi:hypothetical protein
LIRNGDRRKGATYFDGFGRLRFKQPAQEKNSNTEWANHLGCGLYASDIIFFCRAWSFSRA